VLDTKANRKGTSMNDCDDIDLHELETIERNLSGDAGERDSRDATSGYAILSASGFMILSASGLMIL